MNNTGLKPIAGVCIGVIIGVVVATVSGMMMGQGQRGQAGENQVMYGFTGTAKHATLWKYHGIGKSLEVVARGTDWGAEAMIPEGQRQDGMVEQFNDILARVARWDDGRPKVYSQFGFKLAEVNGEVCIVAMTSDEARDLIDDAMGRDAGRTVSFGGCFTPDVGPCVKKNCDRCTWVFKGGRWACICGD